MDIQLKGHTSITIGEETNEFEDPGAFKEPIDIDPERSNSNADASSSIVSNCYTNF